MVLAFRLRINQILGEDYDDSAARNFQGKFGAFSDRAENIACRSRRTYTCFDSEQVHASKRKGTEIILQDSCGVRVRGNVYDGCDNPSS